MDRSQAVAPGCFSSCCSISARRSAWWVMRSSTRPWRSANRYSWAGQHLVHVQVVDLQQRLEILAQGIRELLGVHADVGGDPGQDVVARQKKLVAVAVEADVTGGVPRGPHRLEVPARDVDDAAVFEHDVGLGHHDLVADHHRRHGEVGKLEGGDAGILQEDPHAGQEVVGVDVAGLEHLGVVGMEADPGARRLPDAPGQSVVVGVDVGDEDGPDVGDRSAGLGQPVGQRRPGVVGVPAGVDDGHATVEFEGVDEDVAQGVGRDGDGDGPQTGPDLLHRGHDVAVPGLFLQGAGDTNHGRAP